ncbi:unnamed protein product [Heterobilharzia americana]|nr:unnamed protein product [Heterobilharzia americana]
MGYMYKFGVWDDQQPVLDPRLPVFFDPSAKNGSHLNGTVIPTAPEWHHAEVGLENVEKFQGASVRSRTVACLQRFTQHSSASGRALHRSTYVQQTRLVRQLNRSGERKKDDAQSESEDGNKVNEQEERVSNTTPTHLFVGPGVFDSNQLPKYDIQSEDCVHPTLEDNSAKFITAATILLGKPVQDFYDNDDINEDNLFTPNNIDRTRVLVTANAWCPVSLRTKDPNSQLLFNSAHKHNNGNITSRSNTPKHSPSSTTLLEPTIRGGTLDGLLIYALNLLQTPMSTSHPDYLFPDVIRLTYPTFTTPEKITERLIQIYVASAPVEPGCQSIDWIDALNAADYLVTIVRDIHPSQLSATLILRLNRFARLLIYDNQLVSKELKISGEQLHDDNQISEEPHRLLADRLLENLPILSSKQTLTNHSNSASGKNKENFGCIHRKGLNGIGIMYAENDIISKKSLTISHLSSGQDNGNLVEINNRNSLQYPSLTTENGNLYFSEPQEESIHRALEFLEYDARLIAQEITQMEEEKFAEINFHELLDIQHLEKGEAHSLGRCVEHFNKITRWAKGMIFILAPNLVEKYATLNSYHQEKTSSKKSLFDNFRSCHTSSSTSSISVPQIKEKHKQNNTPYDSSSVVELTMTENAENENISKSTTLSKNLILLSYQHKDISVKKIVSLNIMLLKMCEVLKHLKQLHNFSSFLALLLAIQEVPECLLSKKSKQSVTAFSSYMKPPNFGEYRRDLEASPLPCLPYLGLIFQQLIHLHIGNPIHLPKSPTTTLSKNDRSNYENESVKKEDDSNDQTIKPLRLMSASPTSNTFDLINVWRCWKHYMVLGYFIKRKEGSSEILHSFPHNAKINRVINEFRDQFTDIAVDKAKDQLITLQRSKRNILSR